MLSANQNMSDPMVIYARYTKERVKKGNKSKGTFLTELISARSGPHLIKVTIIF